MVSGEPGFYDTRAATLWDDEFLYVGFWAEEPFVRARLTERDSLIFLENDLELFIDGGNCYYEFEVNALGTVYEVFFIWKDAFDRFDSGEWDLRRRNVLSFAGNNDRDAERSGAGLTRAAPGGRFLIGTFRDSDALSTSTGASMMTRLWTVAGQQSLLYPGPEWRHWPTTAHCRRAKATFGECSLAGSKR